MYENEYNYMYSNEYPNTLKLHKELSESNGTRLALIAIALHKYNGINYSKAIEMVCTSQIIEEMDDLSNLLWYQPEWFLYQCVCNENGIKGAEPPLDFICPEGHKVKFIMQVFEMVRTNLGIGSRDLYPVFKNNDFFMKYSECFEKEEASDVAARLSDFLEDTFIQYNLDLRRPWYFK